MPGINSDNSPIGHPSGWEECAAWAATLYLSGMEVPAWIWAAEELFGVCGYNPVPGCSHDWTLSSEDVV